MRVVKATDCAWRGRYLYAGDGRQLARVTLDPHDGIRPTLTVGAGRHTLRLALPYVPWPRKHTPARLWLYKLSSRLYHGLDGRYGWGTRGRPRVLNVQPDTRRF